MKIFLKILIFLICLNETVQGQTSESSVLDSVNHFYIGANFGYMNVYQTEASYQNMEAYCFHDIPKAKGDGLFSGLSFRYDIEPGDDSYSSFQFNASLQKIRTSNTELGDSYPSLTPTNDTLDPTSWKFEDITTLMKVEIDYTFLNLELLYNQRIFKFIPLEISSGLCLSYPVNTNFYQTYNIINSKKQFQIVHNNDGSLKYKYLNDYRTIVLYDDEIRNLNNFIFGIKGLIRYNVTLFDRIIISPEIGYYKPLTKITETTDWKLKYSSLGISIMYKIN